MSLTRRTLGLAGLSGLGLASCAPRPAANGQTIFNAVDVHPADYPTVSSNYSAARSALAKDLGLGQQRRKSSAKATEPADEVVVEAPAEPRRKSAASGEGRKTGGRRKAA